VSTVPGGEGSASATPRPLPIAMLVLAVVLAFAAHLRLRAAAETLVWPPLQGDSVNYVSVAYNLRQFGVASRERTWTQDAPARPRPDALVAPGYPLLLAAVMPDRPDPPFLRDALLLQALLGVLTVGLGYMLARPLLPRGGAVAVAALLAISPHLVTLGTSLLTETLFAAAATAFAIALARAARTMRARDYALAGVALGLTALIRPTLQYLPLLLVPAIAWLSTRSPRGDQAGATAASRWQGAGALLLAFVLTLGPWLARNVVRTGAAGDPVQLTSALLHGSYPDFMYAGKPQSLGFPYRFDPAAASIRTPGDALGRIRANLAADPAGTLRWYVLDKPRRLFDWAFVEGAGDVFINSVKASPYFVRGEFQATHALMRWLHAPLVLLGAIGTIAALWRGLRRRDDPVARAYALLAVTMAFVVALHSLALPLARYGVPFRALTFLFALHALQLAWGALARRRA
jgi:hypothetical protein